MRTSRLCMLFVFVGLLAASREAPAAEKTEAVTLQVPGASTRTVEKKIAKALGAHAGVVRFKVEKEEVTVTFDPAKTTSAKVLDSVIKIVPAAKVVTPEPAKQPAQAPEPPHKGCGGCPHAGTCGGHHDDNPFKQ